MLLTKEVKVIPNGKMISYYKNKGYDARYHVPLLVKIEDLSKGSHAPVRVLCDYCKEEIVEIPYYRYNNSLKLIDKIACVKCKGKKEADCNMIRYGVRNVAQLDWVKEKTQNTSIRKYGVSNYAKTCECREKMRESVKIKYGVECVSQSLKVKEKVAKTLYANSSQMTSKQQLYIFNLYNQNKNAELNYPISRYNVDIYLSDDNLIVEYDGGFHSGQVKLGQLTQEEFDQKEIIRNNIIKREGYKQMRIISSKDFLPQDSTLLQMLSDAKDYFSNYPNHSWIEFNIDTSTLHNAENKDGIYYDFGALRAIKDSDISTIKNSDLTNTNILKGA